MAAAITAVLAACSVESDLQSQQQKRGNYGEEIPVTANREDAGTRAGLNPSSPKKSIWQEGDQLTIWTGEGFTEDNMSTGSFTLKNGAGTNAAIFWGRLKYTDFPDDDTPLTAVVDNGADMVDCSSGTEAVVDFSTQQYATAESVLHYDVLYGTATYGNRDFQFSHTMSFVRWTISVSGITEATTCSIVLSAGGLCNTATLDLATGTLTAGNEGNITLTDVSLDATGKAVLYVALFPGAITTGMKAVVIMADGKVTDGNLGDGNSFTLRPNTLNTAANNFSEPGTLSFTFTATSPDAVAYTADETDNYSVTSYGQYTTGGVEKTIPLAWEIEKYEYSDDDGATWTDNGTTKPAWLTALSTESGNGGTTAETGTATVDADSYITDFKAERDNALKNATAQTDYDLSQGGETANCYVISAPGTYKIPLIYGNARKADGTLNTSSFQTANTGTRILSNFINYKGTAITDMLLSSSGDTPTTAELVWSDAGANIVSSPAISGDFLTFEIKKDDLQQGNAVVAVKDADGLVMWSWHLWFAPASVLNTIAVTNSSGNVYDFSEEPLGMKYTEWNRSTYTQNRKVRVTLRQTVVPSNTTTFEITQTPGSEKSPASTLYQWGRKDAFPGVDDASVSGSFSKVSGRKSYDVAIQNPGVFYYNSGSTGWCTIGYFNAWSVDKTTKSPADNTVVKSIYDPSPAGFHLPEKNAFTIFSISNVDGSFDKGWNFWTNTNKTESIYFPAVGLRPFNSGTLSSSSVGSIGYCWTAIASSNTSGSGWTLLFRNNNVNPGMDNFLSSNGASVRPVKD